MVDKSRHFVRSLPTGVITEEMKEMEDYDLLEYTGQLYRRMDRIINILRRHEVEGIHTVDSLIFAIGRQASNEYKKVQAGYYVIDGDSHDD